MNNTLYFDSAMTDNQRREELYKGQLFVYTPRKTMKDFIAFAQGMIEDAFGGLEPTTAQYEMSVEDYVAILKKLKPAFIHHPESKRHLQNILSDLGCDQNQTYFDVPRMRSSTSDNYLTSGIAYAFHPHRDTWYSAPMNQINWWLPIYEVESSNVMAFHPEYFGEAVTNSSGGYNYQEWVATSRKNAANHIKKDTRVQPKALTSINENPQLRVVTPPGGVLVFSGSHLHSSVPNDSGKTRFSIDFRTVHLGDLKAVRGAKNVDSACTGTTMKDYLRLNDLSHIPQSVIDQYMDGDPSLKKNIRV